MMQYIAKSDERMKTMESQLSSMRALLSQRAPGTLPSQTETNPKKEEANVVMTRSKKAKEEQKKKEESAPTPEEEVLTEENPTIEKKKEKEVLTPPQVSVPFPQRLKDKSEDRYFARFVEMLKGLHINIPFAEAIAQMPKYAKYLKEILSNKGKLADFATIGLNEECSAVILKKLPPKLKDPGSFSIPCTIGNLQFDRALCDLGASINLMPYSVYKKLGLQEPQPTDISILLADRTLTYPRGIVENLLVKVGKFIFPADFVILDIEEDEKIPIILGRPFLNTGDAVIEVRKGRLTLRLGDEEEVIKVYDTAKSFSSSPFL